MSKDIESINRDMENKVDYDQMASHVSTVVEQTTNSWGVAIDNVNESIKNVGDQIQNVDNSIKTWMRFSEDGQVLGKSNSPLATTITNEKISFTLNGSEIAYITGNRLYITNSRVMERFSIGVKDSGHFDWVMSGKGMSLKWHEESDDD